MHASIRLLRDEYLLTTDPREGGDRLTNVPAWEARWLITSWRSDASARHVVRRAIREVESSSWLNEQRDHDALVWITEQVEAGRLFLLRARRAPQPLVILPNADGEAQQGDDSAESVQTHFIEIKVVDDDGEPVGNVAYSLKLPDGRVQTGRTNRYGVIYVSGIDPGSCKLTLTELDAATWEQG